MKLLTLMVLASISDSQLCEPGQRCTAELTVNFRAEIKPSASLRWDVYDIGDNRFALDYTSQRFGIERRGVVVLVRGTHGAYLGELATLLLLDDLRIQTAPGVVAYRVPGGVEALAGVLK